MIAENQQPNPPDGGITLFGDRGVSSLLEDFGIIRHALGNHWKVPADVRKRAVQVATEELENEDGRVALAAVETIRRLAADNAADEHAAMKLAVAMQSQKDNTIDAIPVSPIVVSSIPPSPDNWEAKALTHQRSLPTGPPIEDEPQNGNGNGSHE